MQVDGQMGRQTTVRQTDRQAISIIADRLKDLQTEEPTGRQTDRQTCRQAGEQAEAQTDWWTDSQNELVDRKPRTHSKMYVNAHILGIPRW